MAQRSRPSGSSRKISRTNMSTQALESHVVRGSLAPGESAVPRTSHAVAPRRAPRAGVQGAEPHDGGFGGCPPENPLSLSGRGGAAAHFRKSPVGRSLQTPPWPRSRERRSPTENDAPWAAQAAHLRATIRDLRSFTGVQGAEPHDGGFGGCPPENPLSLSGRGGVVAHFRKSPVGRSLQTPPWPRSRRRLSPTENDASRVALAAHLRATIRYLRSLTGVQGAEPHDGGFGGCPPEFPLF
jgi:hypothetical protein